MKRKKVTALGLAAAMAAASVMGCSSDNASSTSAASQNGNGQTEAQTSGNESAGEKTVIWKCQEMCSRETPKI